MVSFVKRQMPSFVVRSNTYPEQQQRTRCYYVASRTRILVSLIAANKYITCFFDVIQPAVSPRAATEDSEQETVIAPD